MSRRRRGRSRSTPVTVGEWRDVAATGLAAGLDDLGVTSARSWSATRGIIEERRSVGLAGAMEFTYRNPARSTDPTRLLRHATSLVVGARSYLQAIPDAPSGVVSARVARYATADHYARLRLGLDAVGDALRDLGFRAVVLADDNALVDREAAWRAGLGWYGHNSLLLRPGHGSWCVLGSVVTDARLPRPLQPVGDGCGPCRRCVPACPTGAIGADRDVDARRCLAWLLQAPGDFPIEFRESLGDRLYGCDDCQEVCPPNRVETARAERSGMLPVEQDPGVWLDAVDLLGRGDDDLMAVVDRWYLPGRDLDVVRRNLLVILGNSGPVVRPGVAETLHRYATGSDARLAEHARWAQERLALNNGTS